MNGKADTQMLFSKKRIHDTLDKELLHTLEKVKQEWLMRKALLEKSIEPSYELVYELKVAEVKYLFLLREAKSRNLSMM